MMSNNLTWIAAWADRNPHLVRPASKFQGNPFPQGVCSCSGRDLSRLTLLTTSRGHFPSRTRSCADRSGLDKPIRTAKLA